MYYLKSARKVHFIGIGGAGMSALAYFLLQAGYQVSGSDSALNDRCGKLAQHGAVIFEGHRAENCSGADLCVCTPAVFEENPELTAAKSSMPVLSRAGLLSEISSLFSRAIGIAGTHGKTTASAMTFEVLLSAGQHPAAVVGGETSRLPLGGCCGSDDLLVYEACEFKEAFLYAKRTDAVILNIDSDHLDCYRTDSNLDLAFAEFAAAADRVFLNGDDPRSVQAIGGRRPVTTFGLNTVNDYSAAGICSNDGFYSFDILEHSRFLCAVSLQIPGRHNIYNALAACAVTRSCGVSPQVIGSALSGFKGASRRFEIVGRVGGVTVADDYAHHPSEIAAVLAAAREMGFEKITAVFQPFTYSRTAALLSDFAGVLSGFDRVLLAPIMGSREKNTWGVTSGDLCAKIEGAEYAADFDTLASLALKDRIPGELIITLGCGNIYLCGRKIVRLLTESISDAG